MRACWLLMWKTKGESSFFQPFRHPLGILPLLLLLLLFSHLEDLYVNAIITHFLWCNQTQLGFQMKICHSTSLPPSPSRSCGKNFCQVNHIPILAILSPGKWSKIKLNYGNWKWKAKIKRIMSRSRGGWKEGRMLFQGLWQVTFPRGHPSISPKKKAISYAPAIRVGEEVVGRRLKQQARRTGTRITTIQDNTIKADKQRLRLHHQQPKNFQIMEQKLAWSRTSQDERGGDPGQRDPETRK